MVVHHPGSKYLGVWGKAPRQLIGSQMLLLQTGKSTIHRQAVDCIVLVNECTHQGSSHADNNLPPGKPFRIFG
jgi:hypothetical protein